MKKRLASVLAAAALTLSPFAAFAADFTSSAQNNDAPTVRTADGTQPRAASADVETSLENGSAHVEVTPWNEKDAADTPSEVTDILNNAYQDMKGKSNEELFPDLDAHLEELKAENPQFASVTAADMLISNLFDVSVVDNATNAVINPDGTITLELDFGKDSMPLLMYHNYETGKWEYVPTQAVGNGIYTLTLTSLSPIAVLVPAPLQASTTVLAGAAEDTTAASKAEKSISDTTTPVSVKDDKKKPADKTGDRKNDASQGKTDKKGSTVTAAADTKSYTYDKSDKKSAAASTDTTKEDTATSESVATASESNYTLAAAGIAVGLVGAVLILKARKSLDR